MVLAYALRLYGRYSRDANTLLNEVINRVSLLIVRNRHQFTNRALEAYAAEETARCLTITQTGQFSSVQQFTVQSKVLAHESATCVSFPLRPTLRLKP